MSVKRLEDSPLVLRRPQAAISHIGGACRRCWGLSTKNSLLGEFIQSVERLELPTNGLDITYNIPFGHRAVS